MAIIDFLKIMIKHIRSHGSKEHKFLLIKHPWRFNLNEPIVPQNVLEAVVGKIVVSQGCKHPHSQKL